MTTATEPRYAGFWIRVAAALLDTIWVVALIAATVWVVTSVDAFTASEGAKTFWYFMSWDIIPAIVVIVLWVYRSATPGKEVLKLTIVDARTLQPPSKGQLIGRYLGYYISMIPLFLGIIWVAFDKRKQGWHDKLAGTLVIYT